MPTTQSRTAKKTAASRKPAAKKTTAAPPKKRIVRKPKEKAHEFNAYIPDLSIAERYVNRQVFGVWDAKILDKASALAKNVILFGDTGSGKTMLGEAYAAKRRRPYYSLPCDVSIDPSALFGRMQPTDVVGKFEWQDGPVTEVVRGPCGLADLCTDADCIAGVLNISEINFMPPKIAASLYPLLDGRRYIPLLGHRGEVVRAHKGLVISADMNPNYRGTIELNAAFWNRFYFKLPWGYDDTVEEQLVHFPTLREIVRKLREMQGVELVTPVSTNMMMEFEECALDPDLGIEFATMNFTSAFQKDEKQAVERVFELDAENMERDRTFRIKELRRLARASKSLAVEEENDDDLEEVEVEFEEDDD